MASLIGDECSAREETDETRMRLRVQLTAYMVTILLAELTGWQPAYAGLEGFRRGLAQTAEWFYPANLALYRPGTGAV